MGIDKDNFLGEFKNVDANSLDQQIRSRLQGRVIGKSFILDKYWDLLIKSFDHQEILPYLKKINLIPHEKGLNHFIQGSSFPKMDDTNVEETEVVLEEYREDRDNIKRLCTRLQNPDIPDEEKAFEAQQYVAGLTPGKRTRLSQFSQALLADRSQAAAGDAGAGAGPSQQRDDELPHRQRGFGYQMDTTE